MTMADVRHKTVSCQLSAVHTFAVRFMFMIIMIMHLISINSSMSACAVIPTCSSVVRYGSEVLHAGKNPNLVIM